MPRRILGDNGTQFISGVMQQITHCFGIQQCFTPLYHPEVNPVERKNRDLKAQLGIYVGTDHSTWDEKLPTIRFAMNSSKCGTTGFTTAYLTFGRELRTPDDANRDLRTVIQSENFLPEITPKLLTFADTMQVAQQQQEKQQDQRKEYADKHRRRNPGYQKDDLVWVNTHTLSRRERQFTSKLAPKRDGPSISHLCLDTLPWSTRRDPSSTGTNPQERKTSQGGTSRSTPDSEEEAPPELETGLLVGTTSCPEGESVTTSERR
ncbi:Pro-Pol polyprotein [Anthophora retusa]